MNAKANLAMLFSLLNQGESEYKDSQAFIEMEQKPDIIKGIEELHLPEVTRLICLSDALLHEDWAEPYRILSMYVRNTAFEPRELLDSYTKDDLDKHILAFNYPTICKRLIAFYKYLQEKINEWVQDNKRASGRIRTIDKQISEATSDSDTPNEEKKALSQAEIDALVTEKKDLNDRVTANKEKTDKYRAYIKKHKAQFELIEEASACSGDNFKLDPLREKAYEIVEELQMPGAFEYIQSYIRNCVIDEEFAELLKSERFQKKVTAAFENEQLCNYAFPVLIGLYEENAIDIESPVFSTYIESHIDLLAEFLVESHDKGTDWLSSSEYHALLDLSIQFVLGTKSSNNLIRYWSILTEDEWVDLVERIEQRSYNRLEENLCRFIHGLTDNCAHHFLSIVTNGALSDKVFLPDLYSEMLKIYDPDDHDMIVFLLRELEQSKKKAFKRNEVLQRKIDRQPSEIFSAVYTSIQQLEELAISLRYTDGSIDCKLIARQIIEASVNIREGLTSVGLDTIVDPEDWKLQNVVEFDPEKHSDSGLGFVPGRRVQMKTMGFSYIDDEKERRYEPSLAFVPHEKRSIGVPEQNNPRLPGNRYDNRPKHNASTNTQPSYPGKAGSHPKPSSFPNGKKGGHGGKHK